MGRRLNYTRVLFTVLGTVAVLALVTGGFWYSAHSSLSHAGAAVDSAWGELEGVLKKRYDLIPELIGVASKYSKDTTKLQELLDLRRMFTEAESPQQKIYAAMRIERSLPNANKTVLQYPGVRGDRGYHDIKGELDDTGAKIPDMARKLNDAVQRYNTLVTEHFPENLVAEAEGFAPNAISFEVGSVAVLPAVPRQVVKPPVPTARPPAPAGSMK